MSTGSRNSLSKKSKKVSGLETEIEKARLNKDWETALRLVNQYKSINDSSVDPLLELLVCGEHYLETGNITDAKLLFSKAYDKNPEDEVRILVC
jgi:hypothetical protein